MFVRRRFPRCQMPVPWRALLRIGAAGAFAGLLGCQIMRAPETPMHASTLRGDDAERHTVIVLLPGFGDSEQTFANKGFIESLRRANKAADVVVTDAHFGYYRTRTLVPRLQQDVIRPLLQKGYSDIYLAGVSIGGYGAIGFARVHPEHIRGLLLFAPYLGPKSVVQEVRAAGGLCAYQGSSDTRNNDEGFARQNFIWLRDNVCQPSEVTLYTAVGEGDSLAPAIRELSSKLPKSHTLVLKGGHGWDVWTPAAEILTRRALSSSSTDDEIHADEERTRVPL